MVIVSDRSVWRVRLEWADELLAEDEPLADRTEPSLDEPELLGR